MKLSKRHVVQGLIVFLIVAFALRESRILWGIPALGIFDLAYWGIHISDEVYTFQNVIAIWHGCTILVYSLRPKGSPKVQSPLNSDAPEPPPLLSGETRQKGKGRERSPFEMADKRWKLVFPKKKEEN